MRGRDRLRLAGFVWGEEVVLFEHVLPELAELGGLPGVLTLVQRDLKLLLAFNQLLQCALAYLHFAAPSTGLSPAQPP